MAMTGKRSEQPGSVDALVDEMSKASFPASDSPQLDGVLNAAPAANAVPRHPAEHAPPPEAAPGGDADAALDVREGRYPVGDAGELWIRTEPGRVTLTLPSAELRLGAAALEQLIGALERHRPPLTGRR
jgi:hypothetical protein